MRTCQLHIDESEKHKHHRCQSSMSPHHTVCNLKRMFYLLQEWCDQQRKGYKRRHLLMTYTSLQHMRYSWRQCSQLHKYNLKMMFYLLK